MKYILSFVLLFFTVLTFSQTKLLSWNLENFGKSKSQKKLTTDELTKLYQDNIDEHRSLKNKADFIEENIILARQILTELMKNEEFLAIIESEKLTNIPSIILERKH